MVWNSRLAPSLIIGVILALAGVGWSVSGELASGTNDIFSEPSAHKGILRAATYPGGMDVTVSLFSGPQDASGYSYSTVSGTGSNLRPIVGDVTEVRSFSVRVVSTGSSPDLVVNPEVQIREGETMNNLYANFEIPDEFKPETVKVSFELDMRDGASLTDQDFNLMETGMNRAPDPPVGPSGSSDDPEPLSGLVSPSPDHTSTWA